jgi:hypothetical protein
MKPTKDIINFRRLLSTRWKLQYATIKAEHIFSFRGHIPPEKQNLISSFPLSLSTWFISPFPPSVFSPKWRQVSGTRWRLPSVRSLRYTPVLHNVLAPASLVRFLLHWNINLSIDWLSEWCIVCQRRLVLTPKLTLTKHKPAIGPYVDCFWILSWFTIDK